MTSDHLSNPQLVSGGLVSPAELEVMTVFTCSSETSHSSCTQANTAAIRSLLGSFCTHTHTHTHTHTNTHTHEDTHRCTQTYAKRCTHTCTNTHTQVCTYTHTQVHSTHTHPVQSCLSWLVSSLVGIRVKVTTVQWPKGANAPQLKKTQTIDKTIKKTSSFI